jgi:hypothetical protein
MSAEADSTILPLWIILFEAGYLPEGQAKEQNPPGKVALLCSTIKMPWEKEKNLKKNKCPVKEGIH